MTFDRLPVFPLPLVLLPGATIPLHIFEPRYRRMLADCLAGDRRFGIVLSGEDGEDSAVRAHAVGCIADIVRTEELPDGRSNVVVQGGQRFELLSLIETATPYRVCRARSFDDDEVRDSAPLAALTALAERLRTVFQRVGAAARVLADDPDPLPSLPNDAALLSFVIAAHIDLDLDTRQALLASRSPLERLRQLDAVLTPALGTLGSRAHVHTIAKTNGRGSHPHP